MSKSYETFGKNQCFGGPGNDPKFYHFLTSRHATLNLRHLGSESARLSKIAKNLILFTIFGFPRLTKATKVVYVLRFPGLQRFGSRATAF